jgi:ATP-dependent DNA helicase DinG
MIPSDLDLPQKFTSWRPNQLELAAKIAASLKYGYLLDSPTGTGKSLIAATAQRLLQKNAVYLCTTKQLQDQILKDFPYAETLMGRSNYLCLKYPKMFPRISAEDCMHSEDHPCDRRGSCPYIVAKMRALRAPLAVLNTSYFLSEANYVGMFKDVGFLIIDELDALEAQLMGFIQLSVTKKQLDRINVAAPKYKTKFECWVEWANEMLKQLEPELERLTMATEQTGDWGGVDIFMLKRKSAIARLVSKLRYFVREVDSTWVPFYGEEEWVFKPTWISKYSSGVLWKHAKKVLGMSATILDPRQLTSNIGLTYGDERTYEYKALPSPFPKEHRPVHFEPCANIINKNMEEALPKLASAVERILERHPNEKILCHVVSYKIRDYLMKNINSPRFVSHTTADRTAVLEKFKETSEPKVLISPSMERGVDLPGEECRVIIIAKVPYPDLGDPQINKRVHASKDGNSWYAHRTVSAIVQMSGRAVRSVDDWATTYILDEQFSKLFREWNNMFPAWYREAVIM